MQMCVSDNLVVVVVIVAAVVAVGVVYVRMWVMIVLATIVRCSLIAAEVGNRLVRMLEETAKEQT